VNKPPDVIWLQWYVEGETGKWNEDETEFTPDLVENPEPTWESSQVEDYDVKYVRADRLSEVLDLLQWIYDDGYGGEYGKDIQYLLVKNKNIK